MEVLDVFVSTNGSTREWKGSQEEAEGAVYMLMDDIVIGVNGWRCVVDVDVDVDGVT